MKKHTQIQIEDKYNIHSQIHDFEVAHVVRSACVLPVPLQSTYKPYTSIGTFR